ncbi:hypothetical protein BBJ29_008519 [Phytophthora kernoviae]|uniref:Spp2/MOS2 G-patch domain-containing protein n=1 Tax=Phytophthora kernoviae TaxID=325452 RepID=A0A3F2RX18_9STRA|nr:hypothetical protein BBP00_00002570 [Phytophthora kernoviae]RLN70154.1 hypothetical protein BBJ29_008519 [Phytophthora kernoviae]
MQLTGFALKKGKKKALVASVGFSAAAPTAPQTAEKVFVTDFDPSAPAELPADGKPPLVIPLVETNAWSVTATTEEIATQKAAKQLIEEAKAAEQTTEGNTAALVISSDREKKRTELFQDGTNRAGPNGNKKPILQQNAVPGLDQMADVTDKYRHDVALRPDAPDVHSDVYESVPVEAFGAALLRGMGWKGSVDTDDVGEAPQPRHKLLGLGATKRPKVPGAEDKNKKRKKYKKQQEEQEEKTTERRLG